MKQLDAAATALAKKKLPDALGHLVAAWKARPLPALGDLVERFEAVHSPPAFDGTTAAFVKAAKKPDVSTLGSLARALRAPKTADTLARLDALVPHLADPRVGAALLALVRDAPWTSNGARPVWTRTFDLLARLADPRLLDAAKQLPAAWKFREAQREWMQRQLDRTVEAVTATRARQPIAPLTGTEQRQVDALMAGLTPSATPKAPSGASRAQLLANVYAHPDDDGPRLVFADWLLEQNDPWGEFITLQFKPELTKAEKSRAAALQTKHGKAWLGALAGVTLKDVSFRRGFPSRVVARFKGQREVEQFGDASEWATVEDLSWSLPGAWTADEARWQQHLPKHARPRVMAVQSVTLARLLEAKTPWPVEVLTVTTHDVEVMRRFADSGLFPRVRALTINHDVAPQFFTSGWLKDVPELTVTTHNPPPRPWLEALAHRGALTVEQSRVGTWRFSKGSDGRLSTLHLAVEPSSQGAVQALETLAGAVTTLTTEGVSPAMHQALLAAMGTRPVSDATPARRIFVAAMALEDGWALVDKKSFLRADAAGRIISEVPLNTLDRALFSPDGTVVACAFGQRIEWRDAKTGALVEKEDLGDSLRAMAFSADGKHLLLRLEKQLEVRRWPERSVRWSTKAGTHPAKPASSGVSVDGATVLAALYDETLRVSREGQKRATTVKAPGFSPGMLVLADDTFLLSSRDGFVRRFSIAQPDVALASWKVPESFAFLESPDGTKVAAGPLEAYVNGEGVYVIELSGTKVTVLEGPLKALAWSKRGEALLCSDGTKLVVKRA